MKKSMKKFMIACAAVSSIAIAAGMSAMAAEVAYDAENNAAPINVPAEAADGEQMTVLVVPTDKKSSVTDADILYINQAAKGELPATALLKGESLANGKYSVLVGYYDADKVFHVVEDTFTIGAPAAETHKVKIGDANGNGSVTAADATAVLKHTAKVQLLEAGTDNFVAAARSNGNDTITAADATCILKYTAKMNPPYINEDYEWTPAE